MFRTLFAEEARTQLSRNAAVMGICSVVLLGFLGLWWLLARVGPLAVLMQMASMAVIIAMPAIVLVQIAVEYWQSMYGQRGYLTMTVPVRGRVLFTAKALYACAMALVAGALDLAGLVAWFAVLAHATGTTLGEVLAPLRDALTVGGPGPALATFFIVSSLVGLLTVIVEIGAVMSIGAQGRFNHLDIGAPLIGIVLLYVGNQVLGRALGFDTYKLKYGHRGINQPVLDRATGMIGITAHNHGFAVDAPTDHPVDTAYGRVEVSHVCLNDGVVEGLRLTRDGRLVAFSVQYHPEAAAGPHDASYLFDEFVAMMADNARTTKAGEQA